MSYNCDRCGYNSLFSYDLKRHLQRKKQCNPLLSDIETSVLYNEWIENENENKQYKCEYCEKSYFHASSKIKHKKTCVKKIEIELLQKQQQKQLEEQQKQQQQQLEEQQKEVELLRKKMEEQQQQMEEQQKQIEELKTKPTTTIINHNTTNNNNNTTNNNITINAFGKENYEYIKADDVRYKQFMLHCMNTREQGVMKLMNAIYFNPEHPENQNIKKPVKKDEFIQLFNGRIWDILRAKEGIFLIMLKIEIEFAMFVSKMENEGTRVRETIMTCFMNSVGHALEFDMSTSNHTIPDSDLDPKQLEKMKKTLYKLFYFFIHERTNELTKLK